MRKTLTILFILAFLGLSGIALAEEQVLDSSEINLEEVTAEDLGLKEPKILPDSPIYFLKDWQRSIQSFLTFDPVKKIELKTKIANEKLLETKKLVEKSKKPEIIKRTLDKYQAELDSVKNLAEKIKEKAVNSTTTEKFLEKFEKQKELHQRILQKLETKVPEQVLKKIKEAREKHLEKFKEVMEKMRPNRNGETPSICTQEYSPVCGKDGKTYASPCMAKSAKAEIDYKGECDKKEVGCAVDSDCACGRNKETKECAFGNKNYIDDEDKNDARPCPDFCSGIGGNLRIKCVSNKCQQVAQ